MDLKKYMAEMMGTMILVLIGCGSAVLSGSDIGLLGVAIAFGLAVTAMIYTIWHISGCHINPAVTIAICTTGRMPWIEWIKYIIAQCIGATIGALLIAYLSTGMITGISLLGQTTIGSGFSVTQAWVAEYIGTLILVRVILGSTSTKAPAWMAPIAIGATVTAIILLIAHITGGSINPARSLGPALLIDGDAMHQIWLYWSAPILGAITASLIYNWCEAKK